MTKKLKNIIIFSGIILLLGILVKCQTNNREIRQAVNAQLKLYPESALQDIYKSFFQDEFGPGHLIEDVSFAREYFDLELEDMVSSGRREAEPCGTGRNFYRVPMDLVKDGIIKEDEYFNAFLESSKDFKVPDIKTWEKKWEKILAEMEKMDLPIRNLQRDKKAIADYLSQGEAAVHHSNQYSSKYDPHYRIFSKEQWEKLKANANSRRF
jgi:hypothetical protein